MLTETQTGTPAGRQLYAIALCMGVYMWGKNDILDSSK